MLERSFGEMRFSQTIRQADRYKNYAACFC